MTAFYYRVNECSFLESVFTVRFLSGNFPLMRSLIVDLGVCSIRFGEPHAVGVTRSMHGWRWCPVDAYGVDGY